MQVWFNGRTSAFQAEYVGSIPITCFENEYFIYYARVAQLVEHDLAKVGAAGSSPVSRSFLFLVKPLQHETLQGFFFV